MRNSHPVLYKVYLAYALGSIALGLNFIFLTPTFMPLDFPKEPIGIAFMSCGGSKLMFLLLSEIFPTTYINMWLRLSMMISVIIFGFWATALIIDFFRLSQTSMQLPLMYILAAVLGALLLLEPFINPATANGKNGK